MAAGDPEHRCAHAPLQMFQACIKKYSKHPDVVALFADLNERNSRIMAEVPSITDDMV